MNKREMKLIIMSAIQTQALLHTLEKMDKKNPYKQRKKLALNHYIDQVNKIILELELQQEDFCQLLRDEVKDESGDVIDKPFNIIQSQNFIDCVTRFDNLANEVNLV